MSSRLRLPALLLGLVLALGACIRGGGGEASPPPPSSAAPTATGPTPSPVGQGSAQAALAKLCKGFGVPAPSGVKPGGPVPPAIAQVEHQVEQVRHLDFLKPVVAQPVTHAELVNKLNGFFNEQFPGAFYDRRTRAWQTIGVIPENMSIMQAQRNFTSGQVIGFYVPETGELYFIGSENPSPLERLTLAHELTHAVDDQHFVLDRLDPLSVHCRDEAGAAAVAVVEGSAQFFSVQVALQFFSLQDRLALVQSLSQSQATPEGVPPFVMGLDTFPYTAGLVFVTALDTAGGLGGVNEALKTYPLSTEQILHPGKYPNDAPQPVDVPDLGPKLGPGWKDLDVQDVGEEWLLEMLDLQLERNRAQAAAAGWDGGIYRAWSEGVHTAVVMNTVWDTAGDASEFSHAMNDWIGSAARPASVRYDGGEHVTVLFASDDATLVKLQATL